MEQPCAFDCFVRLHRGNRTLDGFRNVRTPSACGRFSVANIGWVQSLSYYFFLRIWSWVAFCIVPHIDVGSTGLLWSAADEQRAGHLTLLRRKRKKALTRNGRARECRSRRAKNKVRCINSPSNLSASSLSSWPLTTTSPPAFLFYINLSDPFQVFDYSTFIHRSYLSLLLV